MAENDYKTLGSLLEIFDRLQQGGLNIQAVADADKTFGTILTPSDGLTMPEHLSTHYNHWPDRILSPDEKIIDHWDNIVHERSDSSENDEWKELILSPEDKIQPDIRLLSPKELYEIRWAPFHRACNELRSAKQDIEKLVNNHEHDLLRLKLMRLKEDIMYVSLVFDDMTIKIAKLWDESPSKIPPGDAALFYLPLMSNRMDQYGRPRIETLMQLYEMAKPPNDDSHHAKQREQSLIDRLHEFADRQEGAGECARDVLLRIEARIDTLLTKRRDDKILSQQNL